MRFRLGELFCGAGGLACGAVNAKSSDGCFTIEHTWATDYDSDACQTYRRNICPKAPDTVICEDVRTLDMSCLRQIDALAFGFPCNDYSSAGKRKGIDGTFGSLYSYGIKALRTFKPMWFVAENVEGLRDVDNGKTFSRIISEMSDAGYRITPNLYEFELYGVPQTRHRIIIVGIRNDIDLIYKVPSTFPYQNVDNSCGTAIECPPIPNDAPNHEKSYQTSIVTERLGYIMPGENVFNANLPKELQLKVNGAKMSQIYKRLDPDMPAYTVTGNGGGGTYIYHWNELRALTNRERARLQTFPDDFVFVGGIKSVRRQIGMAVPFLGAKIIFESILNTFAGVKYCHSEPNI